jgi:anti-sigma factor ChrR (cupin superfamily)
MSSEHLPLSVLLGGMLAPGSESGTERHLRECPDCFRKLQAAQNRVADIVALASDVAPPAALRQRVLQSIADTPRLVRFTDIVASMLDVSPQKAREYLAALDDPNQWQKTPFDGVTRIPVEGGPQTVGAVAHFVRVEPGKIVPMHEHFGPELGIFLQGRGRHDSGRFCEIGEIDECAKGTAHSVEGLPGVASVMLVVARGGVRFGEYDLDLLPPR